MLEKTGKRIQELRKEKNMTVTALANAADTSRSLISQIEGGYTSPSLQTLQKIVNALDVSLSDFFKAAPEVDENDFVVRSAKKQLLYLPDTQNLYYLLSKAVYQNIEFLLTDYPPHADGDSNKDFTHQGLEFFWVAEGQLQLTVDGKTSVLNKGDSGCFDSGLRHRYVNQSDTSAQLVLFSVKE